MAQDFLDKIPRTQIQPSMSQRQEQSIYELNHIYYNPPQQMDVQDFIAVDVETTGFKAGSDKIIELGAVKFINRQPVEILNTFVNPQRSIPYGASRVNGITDDMVIDSPTIHEVLDSFEAFIEDFPIVGHNLPFDLKFIHQSGSHLTDIQRDYYCTLMLSRQLLSRGRGLYNFKLGTLCDYFGITNPQAHRAYADAYAAGALLVKLLEG